MARAPYPGELEIAKHIPTKRELKRYGGGDGIGQAVDCKAHPDEKGIETLDGQR